jgi:hypothetical protein
MHRPFMSTRIFPSTLLPLLARGFSVRSERKGCDKRATEPGLQQEVAPVGRSEAIQSRFQRPALTVLALLALRILALRWKPDDDRRRWSWPTLRCGLGKGPFRIVLRRRAISALQCRRPFPPARQAQDGLPASPRPHHRILVPTVCTRLALAPLADGSACHLLQTLINLVPLIKSLAGPCLAAPDLSTAPIRLCFLLLPTTLLPRRLRQLPDGLVDEIPQRVTPPKKPGDDEHGIQTVNNLTGTVRTS